MLSRRSSHLKDFEIRRRGSLAQLPCETTPADNRTSGAARKDQQKTDTASTLLKFYLNLNEKSNCRLMSISLISTIAEGNYDVSIGVRRHSAYFTFMSLRKISKSDWIHSRLIFLLSRYCSFSRFYCPTKLATQRLCHQAIAFYPEECRHLGLPGLARQPPTIYPLL